MGLGKVGRQKMNVQRSDSRATPCFAKQRTDDMQKSTLHRSDGKGETDKIREARNTGEKGRG